MADVWTLSTLQTSLYRRGFDFLSADASGVAAGLGFLNAAAQEVDAQFPWPYLLTSTTGTSPLSITDLRKIITVQDGTAGFLPLDVNDYQNLANDYGDLTQTGSPLFFYFTGQTTIATYPVSTDTLTVRYVKVGTNMVSGTDVPAMPDRFRPILVDLAVAAAYREANVPDEAGLALQEYQRKLGLMVNELLDPQLYGNKLIRVTRSGNF